MNALAPDTSSVASRRSRRAIVAGALLAFSLGAALPGAALAADSGSGVAAVYSDKLNGRKTASGARFDNGKLTAAHKTLPFGTKVRLTNPKSKKAVVVTINDRGPVQPDREFDISKAAARQLGLRPVSLTEVQYAILR